MERYQSEDGILVKVGTKVLEGQNGRLSTLNLRRISDQMAHLKGEDVPCALISSGARLAELGTENQDDLSGVLTEGEHRASLTMGGQPKLMRYYNQALEPHGIEVDQALLNYSDFGDPIHYSNMRKLLQTSFRKKYKLLTINGNDVVGRREDQTDNDKFTLLLSELLKPKTVFLLTSADGIWDGPPDDEGSQLIRDIDPFSFDPKSIRYGKKSSNGTGGMEVKLASALEIAKMGVEVFIANGARDDIIKRCLRGDSENLGYTRIRPMIAQQSLQF